MFSQLVFLFFPENGYSAVSHWLCPKLEGFLSWEQLFVLLCNGYKMTCSGKITIFSDVTLRLLSLEAVH